MKAAAARIPGRAAQTGARPELERPVRSALRWGSYSAVLIGAAWIIVFALIDKTETPPIETTLRAKVVLQTGHSGSVTSVALSPDGRFALSGSYDNWTKLWSVTTGKELRSFAGHDAGIVSAVAISPDGRYGLSGGSGLTSGVSVKLWDLSTGKEARSLASLPDSVSLVAFSADGRLILAGASASLHIWEVASRKKVRVITEHTAYATSAAFSPDGRSVLANSGLTAMKLWDVVTGKASQDFIGHSTNILSVALSRDGRFALSGDDSGVLKLWDAATAREIWSSAGHVAGVESLAFSPDSRTFVSVTSKADLTLWDTATGRNLRSFGGGVNKAVFTPDGRHILSGGDKTLKLWEAATGKQVRSFGGGVSPVHLASISPNGQFALSGGQEDTLRLWDVATGKPLHNLSHKSLEVAGAAFSPDSSFVLSAQKSELVKQWDVASGKELRGFRVNGLRSKIEDSTFFVSVIFSPDGRLAAFCGRHGNRLSLWDMATGRKLRNFGDNVDTEPRSLSFECPAAFSANGQFLLSGHNEGVLTLWDVATGQELRSFGSQARVRYNINAVALSHDGRFGLSADGKRMLKLWDVTTGKETQVFGDAYPWWRKLRIWPNASEFIGLADQASSVALSPDGRFAASGHRKGGINLWDTATGAKVHALAGHANEVKTLAFSSDGRLILSGGLDGAIRIWRVESGRELAMMVARPDGEWLTITPEGFFAASHRDTDMLAVVRGFDVTTVGQLHHSLFNPDLVREALAGDPDGEVRRAAQGVNLESVLNSGPPPDAVIVSPRHGSRSDTGLVNVAVRIIDRGKGIGRIEWRVNGVTAGVTQAPADAGPAFDASWKLALDGGENKIEVIAYEKRNLLASKPARTTITFDGPADALKPKLHILAIGVNAYADKGGASLGDYGQFSPLNLAVADAKSFAAEMKKAGATQYGEVKVTEALDSSATASNLDHLVDQMASQVSPRDTVVLYAAAHGVSKDGRFYLIPQDYQGGADPEALASRAVGQERLQDWVANRIKARRVILLLDTCESGALVSGYAKSRADAPASEAAIGRLHEATGRPVLTAAASGKPAFEGYKGHGVFSYALIDALHNGDSNGNGVIELSELVAHVQRVVPKFSSELGGEGGKKGVAVVAVRGFNDDRQSAHFGSTGEDFALARRLP